MFNQDKEIDKKKKWSKTFLLVLLIKNKSLRFSFWCWHCSIITIFTLNILLIIIINSKLSTVKIMVKSCFHVLVIFLLLWQNTITKTTYKKIVSNWVYSFRELRAHWGGVECSNQQACWQEQ